MVTYSFPQLPAEPIVQEHNKLLRVILMAVNSHTTIHPFTTNTYSQVDSRLDINVTDFLAELPQ